MWLVLFHPFLFSCCSDMSSSFQSKKWFLASSWCLLACCSAWLLVLISWFFVWPLCFFLSWLFSSPDAFFASCLQMSSKTASLMPSQSCLWTCSRIVLLMSCANACSSFLIINCIFLFHFMSAFISLLCWIISADPILLLLTLISSTFLLTTWANLSFLLLIVTWTLGMLSSKSFISFIAISSSSCFSSWFFSKAWCQHRATWG